MKRRFGFTTLGLAVACVAIGLTAIPASAASGGACQAAGTLTFSGSGVPSGLAPSAGTYSVNGTLTNCADQSGPAGSGTIAAGNPYKDCGTCPAYTYKDAAGNEYAEIGNDVPAWIGNTTILQLVHGTGIVSWGGGSYTVVSLSWLEAQPLDVLTLFGPSSASITLVLVKGITGAPTTTTLTSTRYIGSPSDSFSEWAIAPATAVAGLTGSVTAASFTGATSFASS